MMTAEQLKNSILQMAMQGKLVEQKQEEGSGRDLYIAIQEEKKRLIKEGKLKKQKCYSEIEDTEILFDIPSNWIWARIGSVFNLQAGKNKTSGEISNEANDKSPYPCYGGNGLRGYVEDYNREGYYALIGRQGALCGNINFARGKFYATEHAVVVETFCSVDVDWAGYFLKALNLNQYATATAQPGLSVANINNVLIPLPPLAEQKRIVAKIEELMPFVEQYAAASTKLNTLNATFPEMMKKSILQEAVQGKLVPQDPNDEPASVLLKKIVEEKKRLIKEGKIKKQKPLPEITEDEIPFDIPESWEWVRIGEIVQVNPRNMIEDDYTVGFMPMPLLEAGYITKHTYEERKWKQVKSGFTHIANDDVVIAKITPCFQNRKSAVIHGLPNGCGAGTTELHVLRDCTKLLNMDYLLLLCKTERFIVEGIKNFTGTAGQQRIGKGFIENYLIPLPPVKEQIRIVQYVKEIFPLIDSAWNN